MRFVILAAGYMISYSLSPENIDLLFGEYNNGLIAVFFACVVMDMGDYFKNIFKD